MFTVSDYITQASFKSLEKQWMPENGKKSASEKRRWNLAETFLKQAVDITLKLYNLMQSNKTNLQ